MADKLINLGEFNDAVRRRFGETQEVHDLLERIVPKPRALYVDKVDRARPAGASPRELFAHASTMRIHSHTTDQAGMRSALQGIVDALKDHSTKIASHEVKPYRP